MKVFVVTLGLATLLCCLFSSTEAAPERQKRSVSREECPQNGTDCLAYAKKKWESEKACSRFILGGVPPMIEWQFCGSLSCGENARKVPGDLSKPYPNCCDNCEIVDDTKPSFISASL